MVLIIFCFVFKYPCNILQLNCIKHLEFSNDRVRWREGGGRGRGRRERGEEEGWRRGALQAISAARYR